MMSSNRAAAAWDIHMYHLLEPDAYRCYGIKNENARAGDNETMDRALADAATRVTAIFVPGATEARGQQQRQKETL